MNRLPSIALILLLFAFGCGRGKNKVEIEDDPEPTNAPTTPRVTQTTETKPTESPEPEKQIKPSPAKKNPNDSNIIDLKRGQQYRHGDLLISIEDVTYKRYFIGEYKGSLGELHASSASVKIENTSETKIEDWPGWYFKGTLEDEHGNLFPYYNVIYWYFENPAFQPDLKDRILPKTTRYRTLYFEGIPPSSKQFVLHLPLDGKTIRCKGTIEEGIKVRQEKEKKDYEQTKEKMRQEMLTKEAARKKDLEDQGLAYYPYPSTVPFDGKNINDWYEILIANSSPENFLRALEALKFYGDPGIPFLFEALKKQTFPKNRELILLAMYPNNIHPNDLSKVVDCLNKTREQIGTRVIALSLLAKTPNSKQHWSKIEIMTKDLLVNRNVKDQVKGYLDKIK